MSALRRFVQVMATGYILMFYSEHLFWARVRPDNTIDDWLITWIAYSLLAFVFLWAIASFHVRSIWALFLTGAVFGWLDEGVIVQTTYESLPFSISWTGLAWHALISVMVGWYAVRMTLLRNQPWHTLRLATVIGAAYGFWAITWWVEPDGGKETVARFASFSLITTILVICAYRLYEWAGKDGFAPTRWGTVAVGALFAFQFAVVAVPAVPMALIVLPALLLPVYMALRRNRRMETGASLLADRQVPISTWNYLLLLAMPLTAIAIYAVASAVGLEWHTNWVLYIITTLLGAVSLVVALAKTWRRV